ncbi:hypothetical protein PMIN05_002403 [Paraphaeosphaeria minitans]
MKASWTSMPQASTSSGIPMARAIIPMSRTIFWGSIRSSTARGASTFLNCGNVLLTVNTAKDIIEKHKTYSYYCNNCKKHVGRMQNVVAMPKDEDPAYPDEWENFLK